MGAYLNTAGIAQGLGKQFLMFETNTASCGGFAGISNSFGAALWGLDYGLQMAYSNVSHALLHFGGQDVTYNVRSLNVCNISLLTICIMFSPSHVCLRLFGDDA